MSKFRFYIIDADGNEPQGTNDQVLANTIARSSEDIFVIDSETGSLLGCTRGGQEYEIKEVKATMEDYHDDDDYDDDDYDDSDPTDTFN